MRSGPGTSVQTAKSKRPAKTSPTSPSENASTPWGAYAATDRKVTPVMMARFLRSMASVPLVMIVYGRQDHPHE
ncbi:hypothetical protein Cco03nite_24970 [Catellatospora coxensis]|uniref:Uncharacterized protein n=1 Tax=Catellatospora coxensis TaxID=310354 RepID=A0A8J3KT71_9ACTN|nr:hypothetical protein Cco03nite_24970 [Catellatospora coxensis]